MQHNRLSAEQLQYVRDAFGQALNDELARLGAYNETLLAQLVQFVALKGCELKVHTLLTPGSIELLTDEIFSDVNLRDFILGLTDRIFLQLSVFDMERYSDNALYQTLASILTRHQAEKTDNWSSGKTKSFIPPRVMESMNESTLSYSVTLLHNNAWLTTLILIALFGNSTIQSFMTPESTT